MKEVFRKRRSLFLGQCLKYLRYVLNDHFVLVLLFLSGFLMVQYGELLKHFPKQHWWIDVILVIVTLALLSLGKIATYIEAPDKLFYLPKEEEVVAWIHQARVRSFGVWAVLQTAVFLLLAPIFFKLGFSVPVFVVCLLALLAIKWVIMARKEQVFFRAGHFSWEAAITYETKRRQSILKFFALFTTVKGISASVKRRVYLDKILGLVKKRHDKTWSNLYLRAFLRSSDYLALTLRLVLLGVLVLTRLYPISETQKMANLKVLLRTLSYMICLLDVLLCFSLKAAGLLILITVIVTEWYLPYKIAKMID